MEPKEKITTCLWFDGQAEEAAQFYTSLFKNSKIKNTSRYGDSGPGPKGSVMVVTFELEGRHFMGLNGGAQFKFNEAVSLVVNCDTAEELDALWSALTADGGRESWCGWLKDKFGLSWQIIPRRFEELASDPDSAKVQRMMAAMMKMRKLDLAVLEAAHAGVPGR